MAGPSENFSEKNAERKPDTEKELSKLLAQVDAKTEDDDKKSESPLSVDEKSERAKKFAKLFKPSVTATSKDKEERLQSHSRISENKDNEIVMELENRVSMAIDHKFEHSFYTEFYFQYKADDGAGNFRDSLGLAFDTSGELNEKWAHEPKDGKQVRLNTNGGIDGTYMTGGPNAYDRLEGGKASMTWKEGEWYKVQILRDNDGLFVKASPEGEAIQITKRSDLAMLKKAKDIMHVESSHATKVAMGGANDVLMFYNREPAGDKKMHSFVRGLKVLDLGANENKDKFDLVVDGSKKEK